MQLRRTSRLIARAAFGSLKLQKVAPTNAFPIFQDRPNAACHMKLLRRDQRIENSRESAKDEAVRFHETMFSILTCYLYIMQSMILKNLLLAGF
jgi:hypothetical protein